MAKIAIIGAGSVEFTRNILTDLGSEAALHGTLHLALHDIDPERLAYAERAANQVTERLGAGYTVSAHADRREAFDGADYLINEIQVGGYDATVTDFEIPRRYGVRQTIADTIGIGGIMRGLRTIPVMIEMGNEMASCAPTGCSSTTRTRWRWCRGASGRGRAGRRRARSACATACATRIASSPRRSGCPRNRSSSARPGSTTSASSTSSATARAATTCIRASERSSTPTRRGSAGASVSRSTSASAISVTESSEHSSEYMPWFLHLDDQVERFRSEIDEYIRRSDENLEEWAALKKELDAGEEIELERNHELASQYIYALETGEPIELYGNVRNEALIDGLPTDACVEVPVMVADGAVQPQRIGPIPPQCLALNRTFLNVVELTVRAVVEGSRDHVYQAALLDPNTAATLSTEQIVSMVDDLIEAHGELIPDSIRNGAKA